jgi:hypothetical protein
MIFNRKQGHYSDRRSCESIASNDIRYNPARSRKRKYAYLVISHRKHYFVKHHSDSTQKYSEIEIKKMLEFLINIVFQQSVGIPMGTNCAPLLADLFFYSYEAESI